MMLTSRPAARPACSPASSIACRCAVCARPRGEGPWGFCHRHPGRSAALTRVDGEHVVFEQAVYVGRDVHPDVTVYKLIRACSVDSPVKCTVARVLGGYEWVTRSTA